MQIAVMWQTTIWKSDRSFLPYLDVHSEKMWLECRTAEP